MTMVYKLMPVGPIILVYRILIMNPNILVINPPTSKMIIDVLNVSFFNIHLSYSIDLLYNKYM